MLKMSLLKLSSAQSLRLYKQGKCRLSSYTRWIYARTFSISARLREEENLARKFDAINVRKGRYAWWKIKGLFAASGAKGSYTFSLLLPPPNVTGTLHLGHALTATVQDVLVKWHQMNGADVLWIPGTDHAGIATQVAVEKNIERMGWTRLDMGREPFLKEVIAWQKKHCGIIDAQLKELGCSLYWPQYYFTKDEKRTFAVQEAFVELFNKNLIYRKKSLINWCCHLGSTISDIEVDTLSINNKTSITVPGYDKPIEFGTMTKFAYKVHGKDGEVVVATTRPETMFADVAVAVHPSDERYSHLRGVHLWHPYRKEKIPLIFDESVDPQFGTGAVKITPGHSFVDYEISERHELDMLTCLSEKGYMTDICDVFVGQKRFDARKLLLDDLARRDLLRGVENHSMELPVCSRSGDVIEVLPKLQWFIKTEKLSKEALEAVESGELVLEPARFNDDWHRWMSNCRDWCISRQLWWGHRIPAFRENLEEDAKTKWIAAHNESEAKLFLPKESRHDTELIQDEDVLDTWFSSSLLPFSSLGWPNKTDALKRYYPLSLMVTGHDILFFWVARMVMLGKELTGVLPFKKVLLHSIMCDSRGKKMSKSIGNVITPENVIDGITLKELHSHIDTAVQACTISKSDGLLAKKIQTQDFPNGIPACGVDSLRMSLCTKDWRNTFTSFYLPVYETNLFFCNKVWQACRFYNGIMEDVDTKARRPNLEELNLTTVDHWILSCLASLVTKLDSDFKDAKLDLCLHAIQSFLRSQLCDIYIESCKPRINGKADDKLAAQATLSICIENFLILLTPFAPYLTEALYQRMPWKTGNDDSILRVPYPQPKQWESWLNPVLEEEVQVIVNVVTAIREIKKRNGLNYKEECKVTLETVSPTLEQYVPQMKDLIHRLTYCNISKLILREQLNLSNITAAESVVDKEVLVHVNIPDGLIEQGAHDRQVKAAALLRREKKLLANIDKIENRIKIGIRNGKTFSGNHHLNKKLTEWTRMLADVRFELEPIVQDLKIRNEPIPIVENKKEEKNVIKKIIEEKQNKKKSLRSLGPA